MIEGRADRDQRLGAARGRGTLHLDRGDLRRGRLDRVLHGELQRHRRGRAAVAGTEQPKAYGALVTHLEQLYVTTVRPEVGPDALQRVLDPCGYVVGVQAVHQHQAGDQVVLGQKSEQLVVEPPLS